MRRILEVLKVSTYLGLTSFGGPIAHLGYFHKEYVQRRQWMDEERYADLVALCQFLPGPASSQVGIAIGIERAGLIGGLMAWLGFTLPSAILLMLFAYALKSQDITHAGWLHGLMIVAVAVVAQAVWSMAVKLATGRVKATVAVLSAVVSLCFPSSWTQIVILVVAALLGGGWLKSEAREVANPVPNRVSPRVGTVFVLIFFLLLFGLPLLRFFVHSQGVALFDAFYRAGALVFGGGHVVLPLLQQDVVPTGWMTNAQFLAGYGAAQAVPGPLFTFSAYLGFMEKSLPNGILGGVVGLCAIFLPAFLLVAGTLPFWNTIRSRPKVQNALALVNAAVVGILLAALYHPVWTSAVHSPYDIALALVAFALLVIWKFPPWIVVILGALGGMLISGL